MRRERGRDAEVAPGLWAGAGAPSSERPAWNRALCSLGTGTTRDREAAAAPPTQPVIVSHPPGFAL